MEWYLECASSNYHLTQPRAYCRQTLMVCTMNPGPHLTAPQSICILQITNSGDHSINMNPAVDSQTQTPVDGTSMNEECVAVDAVGSMPKLQPRVDCQVCAVRFLTWEDVAPRRPTSPTKHTQNPMARKIGDDWWVRPSHGECRGSAWRG